MEVKVVCPFCKRITVQWYILTPSQIYICECGEIWYDKRDYNKVKDELRKRIQGDRK